MAANEASGKVRGGYGRHSSRILLRDKGQGIITMISVPTRYKNRAKENASGLSILCQ